MEYEVLWGDGPLGLTLRPDLGEDMPPVVGRITRLDSAAALAQVAVGHMLVSINGIETAHQGYDRVVGMLQKIARPATLRFRVPRAMLPPGGGGGFGSMGSLSSLPSLPMAPGFRSRDRSSRDRDGRHRSADRDSAISSVSDPGVRTSAREQYTVVWTEGPLGMILQPDKDDCHVPCIRKITGKGVGTGMERATVGDILVAVNGQETKSLGFRSTISLLKTIRKPAVLKFKRMRRTLARTPSYKDPPLAAAPQAPPVPVPVPSFVNDVNVYDIVWREGDLGLKLKPGRHDVPVLSKLTGKGNASGLQFASIGDELVSVNGSPVEGEAYQDTLRMLKHSPKPAVLRFRRVAARQSSTASESGGGRGGYARQPSAAPRRVHEPVYAEAPERGREPEVRKKKRKIPLEVAKEVVAASLGVDGNHALFAGVPIQLIQEGTPQAHLLRKEAKVCILGGRATDRHVPSALSAASASAASMMASASAAAAAPLSSHSASNAAAKESLLRAEEEARMLQEALEKVKSQAKKYEEILGAQKREQLLASATINKSQEVVGRQNNMIAELSSVISGFRRDSYTELEVLPVQLDDKDHESLMSDLESVMNIPVVVPVAKFCAECGATESESQLDLDDDGQYYCKDCWEKFLNTGGTAASPTMVPLPGLVAKAEVDEDDTAPVAVAAGPRSLAPASPQLPEPEAPPRSLARMKLENKAQEEKNARLEAEKKLLELKELRHSGSIPSPIDRQPSMTAVDRTKRDRRGMEEFARALREEEERARADGNMVLAKKLSAQIARIEADAGMSSTASTASIDSTLGGSSEGVEAGGALSRNGPSSTNTPPAFMRSSSGSQNSGPASLGLMKRGVSVDGATMMASINANAAVPYAAAARPASPPPSPPPAYDDVEPLLPAPVVLSAAARNDYDDVNSDEEADDQVEELSDQEEGGDAFLREVEDRNFALARQLDEAHSVVERARMSIMLSGSDDEAGDDFGLSDEQISLFKKLTTQAEERASTVDRLHPEDDSDSDDSGGSDMGEDEEEEEEDDGVWI
ncbi:hypothetical protein PybrP1_009057 [[Pythium] brassicae (nom. inval.)]|nr:hypothetical protein PybrP1_009057 [[Pythium] brassicae (nom. inval.)]